MRLLRSKLIVIEQKKMDDKMAALQGEKRAIEWGSQIRSYVLAPYRMVSDHRTDLKVGNVDSVLDGDLDQFMVAQLLQAAGERPAPPPRRAEEDEV
jgi:peptide chain release factor 2